jgi:hypothetical protein
VNVDAILADLRAGLAAVEVERAGERIPVTPVSGAA